MIRKEEIFDKFKIINTTISFVLSVCCLALLEEKYVELRAVSAVGMTCPASPPIPYSAGVICTMYVVLLSFMRLTSEEVLAPRRNTCTPCIRPLALGFTLHVLIKAFTS